MSSTRNELRRVRMMMVYDFTWSGGPLTEEHVQNLVSNFMKDPYAFLNLEYPEWDEKIILDVEDITDADS